MNLPLLRRVLLLDAAACTGFGVLLLAAAGPLGDLMALPVGLLRGVGAVLLPFAAFVAWLGTQAEPSRRVVLGVIAFGALWVIESIALFALGWIAPNALGTAFVLGQAALVAGFAATEWAALRAPAALRAA
ncbi:hypothetical protein ACE7GA_02715 [Roseomonas sp. CCTCC AB2023176]|uniref:hypothetical protein n=1 Tax=Roseomonas sp. CCTCC AB2023176 TaxID=3342640 RepID=UPI0035E36D77